MLYVTYLLGCMIAGVETGSGLCFIKAVTCQI